MVYRNSSWETRGNKFKNLKILRRGNANAGKNMRVLKLEWENPLLESRLLILYQKKF